MTSRLALGRVDPMGKAPVADDATFAVARERHPADVTFFLRAVPSAEGWSWRLFARTGASGAPRPVYAAERVYPTEREAIDHGRMSLATTQPASGLSHIRPGMVRAS
jgi:hypothetical protein